MNNNIVLEIKSSLFQNSFSFDTLIIKSKAKDKRRHYFCCSEPHYIKNGRAKKKFKTSIGNVSYDWNRMKRLLFR